jgi:hypothetical protein
VNHPAVRVEVPTTGVCVSDRVVIRCKDCRREFCFGCPVLRCEYAFDDGGSEEWSTYHDGSRVEIIVERDYRGRPRVQDVWCVSRDLTDAETIHLSTWAHAELMRRYENPAELPGEMP